MLDRPPQDKMMKAPPAKKEYHFAATSEYFAEVVYADTIQEAEEIYHRVKRLFNPIISTVQSSPLPVQTQEKKDV